MAPSPDGVNIRRMDSGVSTQHWHTVKQCRGGNNAIDQIIAEAPDSTNVKEPTRSLRGLLAKYGPAPSTEEIDRNRAEMFQNFPCTDI